MKHAGQYKASDSGQMESGVMPVPTSGLDFELDLMASQAKSLRSLCVDRGIDPPVSDADIDHIQNHTEIGQPQKGRMLNRIHRDLHELLFAPPAK